MKMKEKVEDCTWRTRNLKHQSKKPNLDFSYSRKTGLKKANISQRES